MVSTPFPPSQLQAHSEPLSAFSTCSAEGISKPASGFRPRESQAYLQKEFTSVVLNDSLGPSSTTLTTLALLLPHTGARGRERGCNFAVGEENQEQNIPKKTTDGSKLMAGGGRTVHKSCRWHHLSHEQLTKSSTGSTTWLFFPQERKDFQYITNAKQMTSEECARVLNSNAGLNSQTVGPRLSAHQILL